MAAPAAPRGNMPINVRDQIELLEDTEWTLALSLSLTLCHCHCHCLYLVTNWWCSFFSLTDYAPAHGLCCLEASLWCDLWECKANISRVESILIFLLSSWDPLINLKPWQTVSLHNLDSSVSGLFLPGEISQRTIEILEQHLRDHFWSLGQYVIAHWQSGIRVNDNA